MKSEHHSNTETLSGLVGVYLDHLRSRKYSPKTVLVYGQSLEKFVSFLDAKNRTKAQEITSDDLDAYRLTLIDAKLAPATLEVYLRAVRNWFAFLETTHRIFSNPAATMIIPQPPRKLMPAPSEADMKRLLAAPNVSTPCGLRDRALLEVAYASGARREELWALTVFDFDLDAGTLRLLGKGRKERVVPIGKTAVHWLSLYLRNSRPKLLKENIDETALWISTHAKRLEYMAFQQQINLYSDAAGIKPRVTMHSLRRACATHMLRNGAHPLQLQMLLGHSTFKTLSQYLRVTITDLQQSHAKSKPGQ